MKVSITTLNHKEEIRNMAGYANFDVCQFYKHSAYRFHWRVDDFSIGTL